MNFRWYISTLIIILTLLGVVDQQQISVPNQEIVLEFTDTEVSSNHAQNTIANIKVQLEGLGAANIQVTKEECGKLIISYYSDVDIARIKESLSEDENLVLNDANPNEERSNFPKDKNSGSYNFNVYEIQKDSGSDWDLNGTFVVELKSEGNRFSNPNVYAFVDNTEIRGITEKVASTAHYNIVLGIDNTSYKIPEVRAGPLT